MKKTFWIVIAIFSILVGLYPIIYFLIDRNFGLLASKTEETLALLSWNISFYGHIIFGGISLLIGWLQFKQSYILKHKQRHRLIGKVYIISVLISSVCGIFIGFYATGGSISKVGFILLGLIWLSTTLTAYTTIRKGNTRTHQKLMIYSYAACFAAVTLRIWLPILVVLFGDFIIAYKTVAWLCWVPNLGVAYLINKKQFA